MYLFQTIFSIIIFTHLSKGNKTMTADLDTSDSIDELGEKINQLIMNRRLKRVAKNEKLKSNVIKRKLIDEGWGYSVNDGPSTWPAACHTGRHQSPVNIDLSSSEPHAVTKFKFVNYNLTFANLTVRNVGHGVMISGFGLLDKSQTPYVYGGNLTARYYLEQFHFHWSRNFLNGSEHTVDLHHHPVEIHFVHIKEGLTMQEASLFPDGIAVMGVFVDLGDDDTALESISNTFKDVIEEGSETTVECMPGKILPQFTPWFFRYEGSLTTPSCAESVIWTVFLESISMTLDQFQALRQIRIAGRAKTDARPIQPLNDRNISLCLATLPCSDKNCLPASGALFLKSSTLSQQNQMISFILLIIISTFVVFILKL